MGHLKKGDRVQLLDQLVEGVILETGPELLRLQTDDGFEIEVGIREVVPVPPSGLWPPDLPEVVPTPEESGTRPRKKGVGSRKKRQPPPMEVDLHVEKLLSDTRGMTTFDILNYQLDTARRQLEFALRKRIQRVVFIHGVGEGVLREELRTLFRRYDDLQVRDADYREYGQGATEVYIPQRSFR